MDESTTHVANPFALMLNPADVIAAVESSERLGRLQRRICKPLDKPTIPHEAGEETLTFDQAVDATEDPEV
jgi:hypothetical protein